MQTQLPSTPVYLLEKRFPSLWSSIWSHSTQRHLSSWRSKAWRRRSTWGSKSRWRELLSSWEPAWWSKATWESWGWCYRHVNFMVNHCEQKAFLPPRPAKGGAPGNPPKAGGAAPTPAAGPLNLVSLLHRRVF